MYRLPKQDFENWSKIRPKTERLSIAGALNGSQFSQKRKRARMHWNRDDFKRALNWRAATPAALAKETLRDFHARPNSATFYCSINEYRGGQISEMNV